jgi:hypothetical protein
MEAFMEVVKAWIILGRSAVDGLAMGEDMEAAEVDGAAEVRGVVVAEGGGGGAVADEERLEADTRLSRASVLKVAGSRLRSS